MRKFIDGFIDYMLSIGILTNETSKDFLAIYNSYMSNDDNDNQDCFTETAIMSLIHYIYHLDSTKKRKVMQSIVQQYFTNSSKTMLDKLKRVISIVHHNTKNHLQSNLLNAFNQWKSITSSSIMKIPSIYNTINTSSITTLEQMHINLQAKDFKQSNHLSSKRYNSNKKNTINYSKRKYSPIFDDRQNEFIQRLKDKRESLANTLEKKELSQCTFSPKINHTKNYKSNQHSPAHLRLYMENFTRKNKVQSKPKEANEHIRVNSNQYHMKKIDVNRLYDEYRFKTSALINFQKEANNEKLRVTTPKNHSLHNKTYQNKPVTAYNTQRSSKKKMTSLNDLEILPEEHDNSIKKKLLTISCQFQEGHYNKRDNFSNYQKSYNSTITPSSNVSSVNNPHHYI